MSGPASRLRHPYREPPVEVAPAIDAPALVRRSVMNVRPFVPECLRRLGPACLAGLTLWALFSISFATAWAVEENAKDTRGVTTVGPPVPLSAAQQSKLAAKRAATIIPTPRAEVAPVKPAPIST